MNLVSSNVRRSAVVVMVLVAFASTAAPTRIGSNKEEECPAPRAAAPGLPPADVALLRALAWAFEPAPLEVRVQAIEDLGLLGDVRALNALAQMCLDPNTAIARAAVRAVGAIRHPRAEEILTNIVKHPGLAEPTRTRALELLPFQNTWSSLRFIHYTASQPNPSAAVGLLAARLAGELPPPPGWVPPAPPTRGKR
jgi:hypothetical protein